jgi:hypothetical protein
LAVARNSSHRTSLWKPWGAWRMMQTSSDKGLFCEKVMMEWIQKGIRLKLG